MHTNKNKLGYGNYTHRNITIHYTCTSTVCNGYILSNTDTNYTILIKHSYQGYLRYNHSNLTIAYQPYLAGEYHPPYMKEAVQE